MKKQSAGLLPYRITAQRLEVMLVHPGGPFWAKKDLGAWSIPKGEFSESEVPLAAAKREFEEETGQKPPDGDYIELGEAKLASGKLIHAWAAECNIDTANISSNTFTMEWPPRSGRLQQFPEVDKAAWFRTVHAAQKLNPAQAVFLEKLTVKLKDARPDLTFEDGEPAGPQQASLF